jgi:hypothetical protein
MNCQFCFTGRMGLGGNLRTSQIVEQLVEARRYLHSIGDATPITNVVFMVRARNISAVSSSLFPPILCAWPHMTHRP